MIKENEFIQWRKDQKMLLEQEELETKRLEQSRKQLKTIQKELKKNNEWLRRNYNQKYGL